MNTPKEVGRLFKPFDWWGWIMSITGLLLMCKFGGVGWIFGTDKNWWLLILTFFIFAEYALRVAYGRVYKIIYYDTVLHNMYEVGINDKQFFVCALDVNELAIYMHLHYPDMDYKILNETHTESFIKTEKYL